MEIRGQSVLLLGYGREGQTTHRFLRSRYPALKVAIADQAAVTPIPEDPTAPCFCGPDYLSRAAEFDTIIHSPGMVMERILPAGLRHKVKLTTATNLFFSLCPGKIVAVTGTKGKSTTSSLIATLLSGISSDVRFAGNIGKPMLSYLEGAKPETLFVLELSSFQLQDIHYSPQVAVLLNIVPEHLDHHGSYEAYATAKTAITRFQNENDVLIHSLEYSRLRELTKTSRAQRLCYSSNQHPAACCWIDHDQLTCDHGSIIKRTEISLRGTGNIQNILAAVSCALHFKVPIRTIAEKLKAFQPLEHRLELVGEFKGIRFVNDSLATIPEALANALSAYTGEVDTVIAGGYDRGLNLSGTGPAILASGARNLILFPDTGPQIWQAVCACGGGERLRNFPVQAMEEAVRIAYTVTAPGKVCLMSPASSSFNLFKDYRDRGDKFKDSVRRLGAG